MIHSWYLSILRNYAPRVLEKVRRRTGGVRMHLLPAAGLEPALQHTDTAIL